MNDNGLIGRVDRVGKTVFIITDNRCLNDEKLLLSDLFTGEHISSLFLNERTRYEKIVSYNFDILDYEKYSKQRYCLFWNTENQEILIKKKGKKITYSEEFFSSRFKVKNIINKTMKYQVI